MTTALATLTFDEMTRLADSIAKSQLFGMKTADQALALMAISAAEGVHPALAARDYHIIQGRPTLKSDAMLSRFQGSGGKMEMLEYSDARVAATFTHPQGGSVTIDWDIERAKRAGLTGKDVWKQYPRNMLRARVISEGVRTVFPGATAGLLAPEEAMDLAEPVERDITPAKPLTGIAALRAKVDMAATHSTAPVSVDSETGEVQVIEVTYAQVADAIQTAVKANDSEGLVNAVAFLPSIADETQRAELDTEARAAWKKIQKAKDVAQSAVRG